MAGTKSNTKFSGLLILTFVIFFSCTPQKRLTRLLNKHPGLTRIDTFFQYDSFFIHGIDVDTVFTLRTLRDVDTVTIHKDKITTRFIKLHDTIQLQTKADPDTIIIEKPMIREVVKPEPKSKNTIFKLIAAFSLLLVAILIFIVVRIAQK